MDVGIVHGICAPFHLDGELNCVVECCNNTQLLCDVCPGNYIQTIVCFLLLSTQHLMQCVRAISQGSTVIS